MESESSERVVGCGQIPGEWAITAIMPKHERSGSQERNENGAVRVANLVVEAKGGDVQAFNRLVGLFQDDIFRMVYYRTRSQTDAEDITQDVFFKAFKNLSGLKDVDRFRSWLVRIALNRVRDHYRKKRVMRIFKDIDDDEITVEPDRDSERNPDVVEEIIKREFWKTIGSMIDTLPRMEREVFLLRFFDHHNIREIADILKKSESTVKTHLYRSLGKFRKEPRIRKWLLEIT